MLADQCEALVQRKARQAPVGPHDPHPIRVDPDHEAAKVRANQLMYLVVEMPNPFVFGQDSLTVNRGSHASDPRHFALGARGRLLAQVQA